MNPPLRLRELRQLSLRPCYASSTLRKPLFERGKKKIGSSPLTRYDLDDADLEYWVNLLSVSTRLRFSRIRARAIRTIDSKFKSMCPVEKFASGVMFDIEEWIFSSFSKICQREKPLSDVEARKLDIVTVARIARAREAMYNVSAPTSSSADRVVKEAFEGALP